jgi:exosome complex component RRP42
MNIEDQYLLSLALNGERIDKRKPDKYRDIVIEKNVIEKAEGSAKVKIGDTEVLVGVKMDVGNPFPDKPRDGVLIVGAEFSPIASPDFEKGPPKEDAIELARVVDRGIRESGAISTDKLCIEEEEKVWMIYVDIHILNHSGNLIDAAALASIVALLNTKMPEYDGKKVLYEKKTNKKLPVKHKPIATTFAKINKNMFIDPNLEEERVMGTRLTVTTTDNGNICALQKSGPESLSIEEIEKTIELSVKKGEELRKLI